ncbi:MAG: LppP/LprE family lipoprotein [Thermomicrobiales bacterium]
MREHWRSWLGGKRALGVARPVRGQLVCRLLACIVCAFIVAGCSPGATPTPAPVSVNAQTAGGTPVPAATAATATATVAATYSATATATATRSASSPAPPTAAIATPARPATRMPSTPVAATGAWLDQQPVANWNTSGAAVPRAPTEPRVAPPNLHCGADTRPGTTAEDQAVTAAGWTLFGEAQTLNGVTIFQALAGYDGMCRPWGYQAFVFDAGVFAGTLAPAPMYSRTDGALDRLNVFGDGSQVSASFRRYAASDPACCPTSTSLVTYTLDRTAHLVTPKNAMTTANANRAGNPITPPPAATPRPVATWLDQQPLAAWNVAGAALPSAPAASGDPPTEARCATSSRQPAGPEDQALAGAGWALFGTTLRFGPTVVVQAMSAVDGMCRPRGYQAFVFMNGQFAGTLAPAPMNARADGSLGSITLASNQITGQFQRYSPADPLCCPSRISTVTYQVDPAGPLVRATKVTTGRP